MSVATNISQSKWQCVSSKSSKTCTNETKVQRLRNGYRKLSQSENSQCFGSVTSHYSCHYTGPIRLSTSLPVDCVVFSLVIGVELSWGERESQKDGAAKKTDVPGYPVIKLFVKQQSENRLQEQNFDITNLDHLDISEYHDGAYHFQFGNWSRIIMGRKRISKGWCCQKDRCARLSSVIPGTASFQFTTTMERNFVEIGLENHQVRCLVDSGAS
ncbi:unnamed protein product [Mytilus edulis]|uniref:Uncharacterized protein n=1 Tax=Mytilus edulis TaxID=6550 RepID=A0A8S3QE41_MYTED|nr:unnamed protein product [Mytilus edulis]